MNKLSTSSKHSLLIRTISAIVLIAIFIPCVILGGWFFVGAIIVISGACIYEILITGGKNRYPIYIYLVCFIADFLMIFWQFFASESVRASIGQYNIVLDNIAISPFMIVIFFFAVFVTVLFSERFTLADGCYVFAMNLYISLSMLSLLYLRFRPDAYYNGSKFIASCLLIVYMAVGAFMNDIGAYLFGITFGKHKMSPRISPNKTWEGFFGGIFCSISLSMLFAYFFELGGYPVLPGIISYADNKWVWILTISLIIPIAGDFGDLLFSAIKRHYGIKDFSNLIPGHGGFLDRFDSITFVAMFCATVLVLIERGWSVVI